MFLTFLRSVVMNNSNLASVWVLHCVSKKLSHYVIVNIFTKYQPIFKIFSLAHSADNLQ